MADGKWIEDVRPDMPLGEAARHVLRLRLDVVRDALPLAVQESHLDPEHVHRLRVATRRADAALRIFRTSLPDKLFKPARRRLRRVRRAAGAARDWDVFLLDLIERRKQRPAGERAGLEFLVGYAFGERQAAQPALEATAAGNIPGLDGFTDKTVAAVRDADNGASLLQLARPLLSNLLNRLEAAAGGDLADYAHLHQVRIAGKRLRYATEVFGNIFPPELRESIYPRVEAMQETLGYANDSHVAAGHLTALRERMKGATRAEWRRVRAGFEAVLRFHNARLPQQRRRFVTWWKQWSKDGGPQLTALLHREAAPV
jgi:CHAD domain-containing protein